MKEKTGYFHDMSARLNLKALQRNVDQLHSLKFLKKKLDVKTVVDESIVMKAATRLK